MRLTQCSTHRTSFRKLCDAADAAFRKYGRDRPKAKYKVLSAPQTNTKLSKDVGRYVPHEIYSLFLAPAASSGYEVCPWRTEDCSNLCLNCSGRGAMKNVQQARILKTHRLMQDSENFMSNLLHEMTAATARCGRLGLQPVIRLNGTSDLPWSFIFPQLWEVFQTWKFYDYTKSENRVRLTQFSGWDNTLSYSGENWGDCEGVLRDGLARVAAVFNVPRGQPLPASYRGFPVIDGDLDDLRFLDPKGVIVGLRYKIVVRNGKRLLAGDFDSSFIINPNQ